MKKTVVDKSTGEIIMSDHHLPPVKNQRNAHLYPKDYEKNNQPSQTKPGQSMSILEMVQRHRKGLPIDQAKGALYQGEELIPDISNMDLIDRQAYMDSVADALVEVKAKLQEEAKTNKEKEILAKVDEMVRQKLAEINAKNQRNEITEIE